MSSPAVDYETMPTADETKRWNVSPAQLKLLARVIARPHPYEYNGKGYRELDELANTGLIEFHNGATRVWRATPAGFGRLANPLPAIFADFIDEYWRARNWGRVDRLPTQACANCRTDYTPVVGATSDCCPACVLAALAKAPAAEPFDYSKDAQHWSDVRFEQDGAGREGWASTDPSRTKYHHYGPDGKSKCNYQRQHGSLHFHPNPGQLTPAECCSSCDLHILKAQQQLAPQGAELQMRWASIETLGPPYHFWGDNGAKVCTFEGEHRPRYFYPGEAPPAPAERCPRCWASLQNLAAHRADFAAHLPPAVAPITPTPVVRQAHNGKQLTLF